MSSRLFLTKKLRNGFTLIEALIAILLLSLVIIGVSNLITTNLTSERDRIIMECLVNTANSAIEMCRGGVNPPPQMNCAGFIINIFLDEDCEGIDFPDTVWAANCREVEIRTSYRDKTHKLIDLICKFGTED